MHCKDWPKANRVCPSFVPSQIDPDWAVFWEKDKTNKIIADSWILAKN